MLYSPAVYCPEWFSAPTCRINLKYTRHALYACNNDRYGSIPVFESIPLEKFRVVEFEAEGQDVHKIVVRGRFNDDLDCVFVLIPGNTYVVKTVWFNKASDNHDTLNASRYAKA